MDKYVDKFQDKTLTTGLEVNSNLRQNFILNFGHSLCGLQDQQGN